MHTSVSGYLEYVLGRINMIRLLQNSLSTTSLKLERLVSAGTLNAVCHSQGYVWVSSSRERTVNKEMLNVL